MPEFTHREIGMLEIFHDVGREYIASCRFIDYGQSLLMTQFGHAAIELVGEQISYNRTPVAEEA